MLLSFVFFCFADVAVDVVAVVAAVVAAVVSVDVWCR